jgi:hypothetical protein
MNHLVADQLLVPFMIRFFFVFGIIGFAVGVGLVFNHVRMHQFFGIMNRWISMRHFTKWLAVPHDTELVGKPFQRLMGVVFILAAAFSTFVLITQVDVNRVVAALAINAPYSLIAWITECVRWFLIAGGMAAIVVGIMLIFSPNSFIAIETRANHWYSFRRHIQSADAMHMGFDRSVESHPRAIGWIIAAAALVVVADYGILLFVHS